ncbi:unnamed protein product [Caenorhabditis angaria]|uniref:Glycosyltransferase family 92 protein n=1 Tax=Caenorhabditis angaria TaxID=860376 RepID=A0A9P1IQE8_9PELO|nr:unnamed protein product [Caenorhabditis angaria]
MILISQMEENSRHSAIINDILFYNSTHSNSSKSTFIFLITSQILNFYLPLTCHSNDGYQEEISNVSLTRIGESLLLAKCAAVNDPLFASVQMDDFNLQIDIPVQEKEVENRNDHVICMSHLVLYEDGASILSLLKHFRHSASRIFIYAASLSDELYKTLLEYSNKIEIVPWMLPESKRHDDDMEILRVDPNFAKAAARSSLNHCFLKYAPISKEVTLIDLATLKFNSISFNPDFTLSENVTNEINDGWKIEKLTTYRVSMNSQNDVVLNEKCYVRRNKKSTKIIEECGNLTSPNSKDIATSSRSIYIPKVIQFDNLSVYADALGRCTSYKSSYEEHQKLMKFEFELENRVSSEVCEISLIRDDFKCRVAMDYNKKMFRRRTRLLINRKRTFLRFRDGCHS